MMPMPQNLLDMFVTVHKWRHAEAVVYSGDYRETDAIDIFKAH